MNSHNKITQRSPSTGSLPSEQTAEQAANQKSQNNQTMTESDKKIYELVENCVEYAQTQFDDNLKTNNRVLTDVLYDNIFKLLQDKVEDTEFKEWLADTIIENGYVLSKISDQSSSSSPQQAGDKTTTTEKEEYAISEEDYKSVVDRIQTTILLLQTRKTEIFKTFANVEQQVKVLSEQDFFQNDRKIKSLIDKINGNQKNLDEYDESNTEIKDEISDRIDEIGDKIDEIHQRIQEKQEKHEKEKKEEDEKKEKTKDENPTIKNIHKGGVAAPIKNNINRNPNAENKNINTKIVGKIEINKYKKIQKAGKINKGAFGKNKGVFGGKSNFKKEHDSFLSKIFTKIKKVISNSFIGKSFRFVAGVMKKIGQTIKKAYQFAKNVAKKIYVAAKKTVVAVYKTAKFVAKTFLKASKIVGKAAVAGGKAVVSGVKKAIKLSKQGKLLSTIRYATPASIITKIGVKMLWKGIKFIGKKIWQGLKALIFKAVDFFKAAFVLMGKFVNKVGTWIGILSKGIKDKAYRFIIKPIAQMMTSIFGIVINFVTSPLNFMRDTISSIFDSVRRTMANIAESVKKLCASTKSGFKKLFFNKITLFAIILGIAIIFRKFLFGVLMKFVNVVKTSIVPFLIGVAKFLLGVLKTIWNVLSFVGKWLFKIVEWLTNPKGIVAKSIAFLFKAYFGITGFIKKMMRAAGKNSIDTLCAFISGDYIAIAISFIKGLVVTAWEKIKNFKLIKLYIGYIKFIVQIGKLLGNMATIYYQIMWEGIKSIWKGDFKNILKNMIKPVKNLFNQAKDLLTGKTFGDAFGDLFTDQISGNPVADNYEKAKDTKIAVRSLDMAGDVQNNLKKLTSWRNSALNKERGDDIKARIMKMNEFYQFNSEQVGAYSNFLTKVWETGKSGDNTAQVMLQTLLESPELSQKLISVFYFYNPQTGKTQMLRPMQYIGEIIGNIQEMMNDPERDNLAAFTELVKAFDQLNKERSWIVNNQGDVIKDFAENIKNWKAGDNETLGKLMDYTREMYKGDLFAKATARESFEAFVRGTSKTRDVESITGGKLGTSKILVPKTIEKNQVQSIGDAAFSPPSKKAMERLHPKPKENAIEGITLPPGSNPPPLVDKMDVSGEDLTKQFYEFHDKRRELLSKGMTTEQAAKEGYENLTWDQFKEKMKKKKQALKTPEQIQKEKENRQKRFNAMKFATQIKTYQNQGKEANLDGFKFNGKPSILQVNTDGLKGDLYMYSPEWQKINSIQINEAEIWEKIGKQDEVAMEKARKLKQAEEQKKQEEEKQRKREQEILDYSAKVEGGFIEVKIGEDVTAMEQAWYAHQDKRREFLSAGHTSEEADKAGLKDYTWEEWKRYYRKMHGLPEDGIKRIPFEGKRQERKIDWSARYAMSPDELAKYGIEVSEDGPVMIPLENAMKAAGDLLSGAKTIYSVRDGLEVMSQGLKTETQQLRKRNEDGVDVAVVSTGEGNEEGEQEGGTEPLPPSSDNAKQNFEGRF